MISKIVSVVAGIIWKYGPRALITSPYREAAKQGASS